MNKKAMHTLCKSSIYTIPQQNQPGPSSISHSTYATLVNSKTHENVEPTLVVWKFINIRIYYPSLMAMA